MNPRKGFVLPLLLIIVAALIVGGGAYMGSKQFNQSTTATSTTQTSDWKTYTNTKYGFEVQYPTIFKVTEYQTSYGSNTVNVISFSPPQSGDSVLSIEVASTSQGETALEAFRRITTLDIQRYNKKEITVDGQKTFLYKDIPGHISYNEAFLIHNNNLFGFQYYIDEASFTQILSSFKFTTQINSTTQTSNWKMYRNDKYGFELSYPGSWVVDTSSSEANFTLRDGRLMGGDTYWENYDWSPQEPSTEPSDHYSLYLIIYRTNVGEGLTVDNYFYESYGYKYTPNDIIFKSDVVTNTGVSGRYYETENSDHPIGVKTVITIFKKGDDFYVFHSPWQSKEFHKQILSSLRFNP